MAILSEKKGVMMWLGRKGNSEQFSDYLLLIFYQQTDLSFYNVTYKQQDPKKFQRFMSWYALQDISQLLINWQLYKVEKQRQKEIELENYYNSEWHKFFMENQSGSTNELYKKFKNKIKHSKFKKYHKISKLKFDSI